MSMLNVSLDHIYPEHFESWSYDAPILFYLEKLKTSSNAGFGCRFFKSEIACGLKENFSTNFVLQQIYAIDEKKVIRGRLSSKLLGSFNKVKMKLPMTPYHFFFS